jgi:hypothetical protein
MATQEDVYEEETNMASNKLWNTGVDNQGTPLPGKSVDPHWRLYRGPGITNPQPVYVLADQKAGTYFTTSDSKWIWADPSGRGDPSSAYVFQTEFYIEVDLANFWFQIAGKWGADNFGQFTIDLVPLPPGSGNGEVTLPPGNITANYTRAHDFSISQAHFGSLSHLHLNVGWHTLEVWIYNEGPPSAANPAGLNVSALGIAIHPAQHIPGVPTH